MSELTGIYGIDNILITGLKDAGFNTVTFGDPEQVNLDKQNIFPLAHIVLSNSVRNTSTQTASYFVRVVDIIDFNSLDSREMTNKLKQTRNYEDVLHDLDYKINFMWQSILRSSDPITVSESITLETRYYTGQNQLTGYDFNIELTVPSLGAC